MIDRRKLFSFGLASAGLCTTPRWLARWFEPQDPEAVKDPEQDPGQDPRSRQLRAALRTAQRQGKPVLLFVVPDAQQGAQVWNRGKWFGAFLNHGGDLALLEVALCVPACATLAELREIAGAGPIAGDPAIVLLDVGADGDAAKVTPVPCELGDYGGQVRADETWDDMVARQRRHIEAKLRELTEALMAAMHRHGHNLAAAAKAVDARLTDTARGALDDWFAGGTAPADATLVLAAAEVRRRAGLVADRDRDAMLRTLVGAIERRIVKQEVAGARWMVPGGCGSEPETPTPEEKEAGAMIACGMAMVPPLAERFLSFFAQR